MKFKFLKSSHVQIALATGISIIAFAWFSKKVLPEPIPPLLLAVPPLIETAYESFLKKNRGSKLMKTRYWISAILLSTVLIIIIHI